MKRLILFLLFLFALCGSARAQSFAPMQGLGSVQFLSNTGVPLTSGVLYSYQAGTTTQQATFTDNTGTVQNPNPVTFSIGGRATIWLTVGALYKFVLCVQNDGASCAPGDVIFSVDQVPGGTTSSGGGGSSPFTGTFISGSGSPATTGILRLASSDSICWRNQAGSANLCISKNTNDLLQWAGSSFGFNEIASICSQAAPGLDLIWADNAAHRWMMSNNGGTCAQIVQQGNDIDVNDSVVSLHFGSTRTPISSTPPTTNQFLQWNGSQIVGSAISGQNTTVYNTTQTLSGVGLGATTMVTSPGSAQNYFFTIYAIQTVVTSGCSASPTVTPKLIYTDAATGTVQTVTMPQIFNGGSFGTFGLASSLTNQFMQASWSFRVQASTAVQYSITYTTGTGCSAQGTYFVAPNLVQQ